MFVIGMIIGSFCALLIDRLPREEDVILKRSYCTSCNHALAWYDLVPVISYLILKGKCRYCGEEIPKEFFFMEIIGGSVWIVMDMFYGDDDALLYFSLIMILLVVSIIDSRTYSIYHCFFYPLLLLGILYQVIHHDSIMETIVSVGSIGILFSLFYLLYPQAIGMGDILFFCLLSIFLSFYQVYLCLFVASSLGYIYGKIKEQREIPFVPFLSIGFLFVFFFL